MTRRRESGWLSREHKVALALIAALVAHATWFVLIGAQSPIYQACVDASGARGKSMACSFRLLGGSAADMLIFFAQWLPLLLVLGWFAFWFATGRLLLVRSSDRNPE
jgi:hypothetical protein